MQMGSELSQWSSGGARVVWVGFGGSPWGRSKTTLGSRCWFSSAPKQAAEDQVNPFRLKWTPWLGGSGVLGDI
jgi:hypothetical protein